MESDLTLSDSRILHWALSGDGAFRLYGGAQPVFVLTAGGFHPAFQPPAHAHLPVLRRLTLALANGGDFRPGPPSVPGGAAGRRNVVLPEKAYYCAGRRDRRVALPLMSEAGARNFEYGGRGWWKGAHFGRFAFRIHA